jgi:anti-sigma factor RsiW
MLGDRTGVNPRLAVLKDERLAAIVSAYLDGELEGKDLEEFESLLQRDPMLAREVQEMRSIESRLMEMGADILAEPVPEAMLEALSKIGRS